MKRPICCGWLVLAMGVLLVGCADSAPENPPTFKVTGTVTQGGTSVEGATVVFAPKDGAGKAASGTTDSSGNYTLTTFDADDGAVPGTYGVTVTKYDSEAAAGDAEVDYETQYEGAAEGDGQDAGPTNELPEKYAQIGTSGLEFTVNEGSETVCDIQLDAN